GGAIGANPVAVVVPCHRVVRRDGSLCGYHWGTDRKRALLERERQTVLAEASQFSFIPFRFLFSTSYFPHLALMKAKAAARYFVLFLLSGLATGFAAGKASEPSLNQAALTVARAFSDGGGYNGSWTGSGTPEAIQH